MNQSETRRHVNGVKRGRTHAANPRLVWICPLTGLEREASFLYQSQRVLGRRKVNANSSPCRANYSWHSSKWKLKIQSNMAVGVQSVYWFNRKLSKSLKFSCLSIVDCTLRKKTSAKPEDERFNFLLVNGKFTCLKTFRTIYVHLTPL